MADDNKDQKNNNFSIDCHSLLFYSSTCNRKTSKTLGGQFTIKEPWEAANFIVIPWESYVITSSASNMRTHARWRQPAPK